MFSSFCINTTSTLQNIYWSTIQKPKCQKLAFGHTHNHCVLIWSISSHILIQNVVWKSCKSLLDLSHMCPSPSFTI
jgi:hypothetical protein